MGGGIKSELESTLKSPLLKPWEVAADGVVVEKTFGDDVQCWKYWRAVAARWLGGPLHCTKSGHPSQRVRQPKGPTK